MSVAKKFIATNNKAAVPDAAANRPSQAPDIQKGHGIIPCPFALKLHARRLSGRG